MNTDRQRKSFFRIGAAGLLWLGLAAPSDASSTALDPTRTSELTRIRIQHQIDTVEIYKRDGRWWVSDLGAPARPEMVAQTLRQLEALEAHPVARKSPAETLEAYGLQLESARFVRLQFADGKVSRLRLGLNAGEANAIYWARDAGDPLSAKTPAPRAIFRGAGFPIGADLNSWVSPLLFDIDFASRIKALHVEWLDSTGDVVRYVLARENGEIVLKEPQELRASAFKAAEAFAQATSLLIDGFPGRNERLPARGGTPRVRVKVEDGSGKSVSLEPEFSDGLHDYIRHPEAPQVLVKLRRAQLDSFRHTPGFLATSYPFGPDEDDGISGPPPPHFGVLAPHCYHGEDEDEHELYHQGHDH